MPPFVFNTGHPVRCPTCRLPTYATIFPALFRTIRKGESGETIQVEGEASCFYHPEKRAEVACEYCGRFLCKLCDIEMKDNHMCPACMEAGKARPELKSLHKERVLYDEIALTLSILPLLFFYFTLITAPATVAVCIRYWKRPISVVRRTKIRYVIAMIIALLQIAGWTFFFMALAGIWGF